MARIDGTLHIRRGHVDLGRELLHAHRSDHLAERDLNGHTLVHRGKQELAGELAISQILGEPDVPFLTASCHLI